MQACGVSHRLSRRDRDERSALFEQYRESGGPVYSCWHNDYGLLLYSLDKNSEEYNRLDISYSSLKSLVNSLYGILANRYFRLFDNRIAETTTFLVRDVLHYVKDKVEASGCKVIYVDTDSVFYIGAEDLTDQMNEWIQDWAKNKYNNGNVLLTFAKEGYFEKLFIFQ